MPKPPPLEKRMDSLIELLTQQNTWIGAGIGAAGLATLWVWLGRMGLAWITGRNQQKMVVVESDARLSQQQFELLQGMVRDQMNGQAKAHKEDREEWRDRKSVV